MFNVVEGIYFLVFQLPPNTINLKQNNHVNMVVYSKLLNNSFSKRYSLSYKPVGLSYYDGNRTSLIEFPYLINMLYPERQVYLNEVKPKVRQIIEHSNINKFCPRASFLYAKQVNEYDYSR